MNKNMQPSALEKEKNQVQKETLYLVATPIGNLGDLSERARKVLSEVDFIAAEDTRNTRRLLSHFGISGEMISYHEHNKKSRGDEILQKLQSGANCALVTDAGMPAISDPGEDLVRLCIENGITVTAIPGPCAAVTALALSALCTKRFVFEGFLPVEHGKRAERLKAIKNDSRTVILYEAPHRLIKTLTDLKTELGDRLIALCRELTKLNEEILRMTLSDALEFYNEHTPRGEYVLILAGADDTEQAPQFWHDMTIEAHVNHYIAAGLQKTEAIKAAAKDRSVPKNKIYNEYVHLNSENTNEDKR